LCRVTNEQKAFPQDGRQNRLQLVASRIGEEGSLMIHQDAKIYLADLRGGQKIQYANPIGRHLWNQVLRGVVLVKGELLRTIDATFTATTNN
jgi:hypothetical protein